ncbi:SHOCT domain-containing protein [Halomarina rubra]|uniref:SHOCT domain-containing protein n=1 Tax=Halomarina rubra TaxID=2071873 RepID=A0ABD6B0C3_9EURY|nr:SHOCT domain-containing protein [Halomarina rubra]
MSADTPRERLRENATGIASTLVTGTWLAALFLGVEWWLPLMLFGYIVVIPIVSLLFGDDEDREEWWDEDGQSAWWGTKEDWFGTGWGSDPETDRDTATTASPASTPDETPLETLRRRYAAGELTDAQFEAKLERLLETDTLENAEERAARRERESLRDRDRLDERDREYE